MLEPTSEVAPAPLEVHARRAPLWRRWLAFLIDAILLGSIALAYLWIASSITKASGGRTADLAAFRSFHRIALPGVLLFAVLITAYSSAFGFLWGGQSIGRRALGIWLVDQTGLAPTPVRSIVRALLAWVSFGLLMAGFWLVLFDRKGQSLHDKLTGTYLVRL